VSGVVGRPVIDCVRDVAVAVDLSYYDRRMVPESNSGRHRESHREQREDRGQTQVSGAHLA
jgi:hypothetical protein